MAFSKRGQYPVDGTGRTFKEVVNPIQLSKKSGSGI